MKKDEHDKYLNNIINNLSYNYLNGKIVYLKEEDIIILVNYLEELRYLLKNEEYTDNALDW